MGRLDGGKFLFRDSGIYDDSVFNIKEILGYDVQLNSEMISLYRMAKTTHSMLLFDMASGECGKWWRAQNNIEIMKHIMKIFSYPIVG